MSHATLWSTQLAEQLIATQISQARDFYGEDGAGATALLPILHALQNVFGYVPSQALPMIADQLNVSKAEVRGVLSFYHDFRDAPPARFVLKQCRAEACQARGADAVAAHLASAHGLAVDSSVGQVTLNHVYCLGNCALGPAALLDGELLAHFDQTAADALLQRLQGTPP